MGCTHHIQSCQLSVKSEPRPIPVASLWRLQDMSDVTNGATWQPARGRGGAARAAPAVTKSRLSLGFWKRWKRPVEKPSVVEWPWLSAAPAIAPMCTIGPSGPTGRPEPTAAAHEKNFTSSVRTLKTCARGAPRRHAHALVRCDTLGPCARLQPLLRASRHALCHGVQQGTASRGREGRGVGGREAERACGPAPQQPSTSSPSAPRQQARHLARRAAPAPQEGAPRCTTAAAEAAAAPAAGCSRSGRP
jgi:hypothetical protein